MIEKTQTHGCLTRGHPWKATLVGRAGLLKTAPYLAQLPHMPEQAAESSLKMLCGGCLWPYSVGSEQGFDNTGKT